MPRPASYYAVALALWAGAGALSLAGGSPPPQPSSTRFAPLSSVTGRAALAALLTAVSSASTALALAAPKRIALFLAPLVPSGLIFAMVVGRSGGGAPLMARTLALLSIVGAALMTGWIGRQVFQVAELSSGCTGCQFLDRLPQLASVVAAAATTVVSGAVAAPRSWARSVTSAGLVVAAAAVSVGEQGLRALSAAGERGESTLLAGDDPEEALGAAHVYPAYFVLITTLALLYVWKRVDVWLAVDRTTESSVSSLSSLSLDWTRAAVLGFAMGKLVLMDPAIASSGGLHALGLASVVAAGADIIRQGSGSSWLAWLASCAVGALLLRDIGRTGVLVNALVGHTVPLSHASSSSADDTLVGVVTLAFWALLSLPLGSWNTVAHGRVRVKRASRIRTSLLTVVALAAGWTALQPQLGLLPGFAPAHSSSSSSFLSRRSPWLVWPVPTALLLILLRYGQEFHKVTRGALTGILAGFVFWLVAMPNLPHSEPWIGHLLAIGAVFTGTTLTGALTGSLVASGALSPPNRRVTSPVPPLALAIMYAAFVSFVGPAMVQSVCRLYDAAARSDAAVAADSSALAGGSSSQLIARSIVSQVNARRAWLSLLALAAASHALIALVVKLRRADEAQRLTDHPTGQQSPLNPDTHHHHHHDRLAATPSNPYQSPVAVRSERVDLSDVRATFVRPLTHGDRLGAGAASAAARAPTDALPSWLPIAGNVSTVCAVGTALYIHIHYFGGTEVGSLPLAPLCLLLDQDAFLLSWLTPSRRYVPVVTLPLLILAFSSLKHVLQPWLAPFFPSFYPPTFEQAMAPGLHGAPIAGTLHLGSDGDQDNQWLFNCVLLACTLPTAIGIVRWTWQGGPALLGATGQTGPEDEKRSADTDNHSEPSRAVGEVVGGWTSAGLRQRLLSPGPSSGGPITSPMASGRVKAKTGVAESHSSAASNDVMGGVIRGSNSYRPGTRRTGSLLWYAPLCLLPILLADVYPIRVLGLLALLASIIQHIVEQRKTRRSLFLL